MGKKRCRAKYRSKGERSNVASKHKFDVHSSIDRALFKVKARRAGKRVVETIANPNKEETNRRFIRVCING